MNLPSVPTDNLYKFIGISGLLILMLGLVLPKWSLYQLELQRVDIDESITTNKILGDAIVRDATESLNEQNEALKTASGPILGRMNAMLDEQNIALKEIEKLKELRDEQTKERRLEDIKKFRFALEKELGALNKKFDSLINESKIQSKAARKFREQMDQVQISSRRTTSLLEKYGVVLEYMHDVLFGSYVAQFAGFFLTVSGFVLWYMKCQRFQDLVLRAEAETKGTAKLKSPDLRETIS